MEQALIKDCKYEKAGADRAVDLLARNEQFKAENKRLKEKIQQIINHYKKIGFNDTAQYIEQALKGE